MTENHVRKIDDTCLGN